MQYTTNYNLAKPQASDNIETASRTALNTSMDTIDTQLKTNADNITSANTNITALDTRVDALEVDYVVEQGTSGIWTYRKWNSGMSECWGILTIGSGGGSTFGSATVEFTYYSGTFPTSLFIDTPFAIVSGKDKGTGTSSCAIDTLSSSEIRAEAFGSQTALGEIYCYCIGKWK